MSVSNLLEPNSSDREFDQECGGETYNLVNYHELILFLACQNRRIQKLEEAISRIDNSIDNAVHPRIDALTIQFDKLSEQCNNADTNNTC